MKQSAASAYFNAHLPQFMDQQLIANLVSLSARFWIEIHDHSCWSLTIDKGRLINILHDTREGSFGFRTDGATFLAVAGAMLSPQKSFFAGKTKISGNFMEALRTATALEEFFQLYPYNPPHADPAEESVL